MAPARGMTLRAVRPRVTATARSVASLAASEWVQVLYVVDVDK